MSNDKDASKSADKNDKAPAAPKKTEAAPAKPAPAPASAPTTGAAPAGPPPLDDQRLRFEDLAPHGAALNVDELVEMLHDGRARVRANAVLGLAAAGQARPELVLLLRDSEASVANAAAEAIARFGGLARPLLSQIVATIDSTQTSVTESLIGSLAQLVGTADDDLIAALDVPSDLAMKSVVAAAGHAGRAGIAMLVRGTHHDRVRVRINAIGGLGRLGKTDPDVALACLEHIEHNDPVPDARTAAKHATLAIVAREKQQIDDSFAKGIPDFEARKLSASELGDYDSAIDIDEMIRAITDGRDFVRVNAARALAVKGSKAGRAAPALGLATRDSAASVRREAARALAKLGDGALPAADDLVIALADADDDVADEAQSTLAGLGEGARTALTRGLETGSVGGGRRVGELIGKLRDPVKLLVDAFRGPAVNAQVNASLALGLLGAERIGDGLAALRGARTGGDARTREAVRTALARIEPKDDSGPKAVAVPEFETRALTAAELDKHKAEIEQVGLSALMAYLQDGRELVRANAAGALGVLGSAATPAAHALGVLMRDDAPRVRLTAARALDRLGDASVIATADDLVGALRDSDEQVADAAAQVLRARGARVLSALVKGLETGDARHGRRIVTVIHALPDAVDILADAFESPAGNVQVNAALGLGLIGAERVGRGRKVLEGGRTGGFERTREAVRAAIEQLDGPRDTGPATIDIPGFETQPITADAIKEPGKLRVDDIAAFLPDGRAIVRANAAIALGAIGAPAAGTARSIAVLLRDDDSRVRIAAAGALDKLGDDAVREVAEFLVGALRGDPEVAAAVAPVLAARRARVLGALVKGLATDDATHARRINELIGALADACEILCDAFDHPAELVQVNAALGIGMLGAKRAGTAGRKKLESARTGGYARTREAVFKALAMLNQ